MPKLIALSSFLLFSTFSVAAPFSFDDSLEDPSYKINVLGANNPNSGYGQFTAGVSRELSSSGFFSPVSSESKGSDELKTFFMKADAYVKKGADPFDMPGYALIQGNIFVSFQKEAGNSFRDMGEVLPEVNHFFSLDKEGAVEDFGNFDQNIKVAVPQAGSGSYATIFDYKSIDPEMYGKVQIIEYTSLDDAVYLLCNGEVDGIFFVSYPRTPAINNAMGDYLCHGYDEDGDEIETEIIFRPTKNSKLKKAFPYRKIEVLDGYYPFESDLGDTDTIAVWAHAVLPNYYLEALGQDKTKGVRLIEEATRKVKGRFSEGFID